MRPLVPGAVAGSAAFLARVVAHERVVALAEHAAEMQLQLWVAMEVAPRVEKAAADAGPAVLRDVAEEVPEGER